MPRKLTEQMVDDLIKLKWGSLVTEASGPTLTSNAALTKVFGVFPSQIRNAYMRRFEKIRLAKLTLLQRLRLIATEQPRKNFGIRFLKEHQIAWITSSATLRQQVAISLVARCALFQK